MIRIWIKNPEGQWQAMDGVWEPDEAQYWSWRIKELGGETMLTHPNVSPGGVK